MTYVASGFSRTCARGPVVVAPASAGPTSSQRPPPTTPSVQPHTTNTWVVRGLRDESRSDRISNDVPRDDERRFIAAQYAFEAVSLPQLLFLVLPPVVEARVLLCTKNKPRAIRIVGCALNQQMNMIWHEAVRENLKAFFSSSAQNLPQSEINDILLHEALFPLEGAESNGVPMRSHVVERFQSLGMTRRHGGRMSKRQAIESGYSQSRHAGVRLKSDATRAGEGPTQAERPPQMPGVIRT